MNRIKARIAPHWDVCSLDVPVAFSEIDPMQRVWHGHYLRYVETAREAYCAQRGLSYQQMVEAQCIAPVIRLQMEFLAPARMGWTLRVRCAHVPGSEPYLNLLTMIHGPVATAGSDAACAPVSRADAAPLLCVVETVQAFIDGGGALHLSPPPMVSAFFARITARERQLAEPQSGGADAAAR